MNKKEMGVASLLEASSGIGRVTALPFNQAEAVTAKVAPNGGQP
jgi:hypothetical protein